MTPVCDRGSDETLTLTHLLYPLKSTIIIIILLQVS